MSADAIKDDLEQFRTDFRRLRQEIGKVVVGQDDIVEGTLAALIAGGHVLLEGVPGLGKTLLVRTIADALHLKFASIKFTPDLMPADLVGTNVVLETPEGGRRFEFQKGPVFANIVLADEINRATPKTQSALLEAMQEHGVTVGGQTYPLPEPFFVLATQNPLEMEGTYPLPEAQLDRFFFKLLVQFPKFDDMETILDRTTESKKPKAEPIFDGSRILSLAQLVRLIPVATEVRRFAIAVVMATHPEHELATTMTRQYVRYGSSPRGAQSIILAAKLKAILDGRFHVAREDIKAVAPMALRHRLILNFEGQAEGVPADAVVENILKSVKEPVTVA
jgi:MoxR-like ATPase